MILESAPGLVRLTMTNKTVFIAAFAVGVALGVSHCIGEASARRKMKKETEAAANN